MRNEDRRLPTSPSMLVRRAGSLLMSVSNLPAWHPSMSVQRLDRTTARAVGEVRGEAVVALTKVNAVAAITQEAMNAAARLKAQEAQLLKLAPLGEAQYQYLADSGIAALAAHIQRLGMLL